MSIENHVPSRETCERLKVAGFQQDTYFGWCQAATKQSTDWYVGQRQGQQLAAPLATELMEALDANSVSVELNADGMTGASWDNMSKTYTVSTKAKPAEALALLWLKVKEVQP